MTPRERNLADIGLIAMRNGLTTEDILGSSRDPRISRVRQCAYAHFRDKGYSYPQIGKLFGRDHSSVVHGVNKHRGKETSGVPGVTAGLI